MFNFQIRVKIFWFTIRIVRLAAHVLFKKPKYAFPIVKLFCMLKLFTIADKITS